VIGRGRGEKGLEKHKKTHSGNLNPRYINNQTEITGSHSRRKEERVRELRTQAKTK